MYTPSPRSISNSCRLTEAMSAKGCQNAVVVVCVLMPSDGTARHRTGCLSERGADRRSGLLDGPPGDRRGLHPAPEAVDRAGHPHERRVLELARVGLALVAQHVVLGGDHVGGRDAG